jgi:ribonucleotide reductase alpha subunit
MISENTQYATLAAHILISNLHRNTDPGVLETFSKIRHMLRDDVWDVIEAHAPELDAMLDFQRDFEYDFFAIRTLERLYLAKEKSVGGKVVERPQHLLLRVALGIWGNDVQRVRETYYVLSRKLATHATPTLFNAGMKKGQFSSCYLLGMDDSIGGIYKALSDCAQVSKWAGGIGMHIHNVRSRNAPIRGTNGNSSGIIPMLRVFNNTARYVNQCFVADTLVVTSEGPKRIADIQPGVDRVFTRDHTYRRVLEKYENPVPPEGGLLEIILANGKTTLVTGPHDILVKRQNAWQFWPASELGVGDVVAHYDDVLTFQPQNIASVRPYGGKDPVGPYVYDLNVQDNHNYLVQSLGLVHNSGRRNGSFAMYLEPWHPDVFDFLDAKKNHGDEEIRARDLFYAMWIPDLFMERVEAGGTWSLMDPDACPGLPEAYGDAFRTLYEGYEAEGRYVKQIEAQKLWFAILTSQIETGTPYMLYKDASNKKSNQKNLGTIKSSNLCAEIIEYSSPEETAVCLTGDTKILTDIGWKRLDVLVSANVYCPYASDTDFSPNNSSWQEAVMIPQGPKYVYEIRVHGSRPIRATANHKFLVRRGRNLHVWKRTDELEPGDDIVSANNGPIPGYDAEDLCEFDVFWYEMGRRGDRLPEDSSHHALTNWIRGVFSATGKVSHSGYIYVSSKNLEDLYTIQDHLRCYGIHGKVDWPGGSDGKGRLEIFGLPGLERFETYIGFGIEDDLKAAFSNMKKSVWAMRPIRFPTLVSGIVQVGFEEVYDLSVAATHHFVANNVVTHNCNLASMALPAFVAGAGEYDFQALYKTTKIIARNLDRVIDVTYYPTQEARVSNFRHRPIGIGVQGLSDVFQMNMMPFESQEARTLNRRIFETMYYAALETSAELAETLGTYETYQGSPASEGLLQYDLWDDHDDPHGGPTTKDLWDWDALKAKVARHGLRNSLSIALMPTASTSQILGNTECIEPITSNMYMRRTMAGEFVVVNRHLVGALVKLGLWTDSVRRALIANNGSVQKIEGIPDHVKEVFKTAWEIKQKALIDLSADRGPFVCQSQSLNLFVTEPTFKKLSSMHFYAFKAGLKTGMYYLRTQSASMPVAVSLPAANPRAAAAEEDPAECLMCSA